LLVVLALLVLQPQRRLALPERDRLQVRSAGLASPLVLLAHPVLLWLSLVPEAGPLVVV
jgi:hypothetical protein